MIARLCGKVSRTAPCEILIDVHGIGYAVACPLETWERLPEGQEATLHIYTYVREDRLDLYGFRDRNSLFLFKAFLGMPGIGPKLGLELCNVQRGLLRQAIETEDPTILTSVKGIGKKTAETLLVELKALAEKRPEIFGGDKDDTVTPFDRDAVEALSNLGYDTVTILKTLKSLPKELQTTEERITAALRTL